MVSDIDKVDLSSISSQPLLGVTAGGDPDPDIYSECNPKKTHMICSHPPRLAVSFCFLTVDHLLVFASILCRRLRHRLPGAEGAAEEERHRGVLHRVVGFSGGA